LIRKLLLLALLALAPCQAHSASSVAFSWPTNWYTLTDGATISPLCPGSKDVNGVGVSGNYLLTVLGNGHTILLPSCSTPSSLLFRITQGTGGPYTGTMFSFVGNTLNWTGGTAYSCGGSNPCVAGEIDDVGGYIITSSVIDLFAPQYNMLPTLKAWVQGNTGANSTTASASVTLTNPVKSGDSLVCSALSSNGTNTITSISDGLSGTYTQLDFAGSGIGGSVASFDGLGLTNGAQTITVNYTAAQAFSSVRCDEYSAISAPDGHNIQHQLNPGTGANLITSPSITTTNAGDIIYGGSWEFCSSTTIAAGTSPIAFTSRTGATAAVAAEDFTQPSAGSIAATFTDATAGAACSYVTLVVGLH
jgi:hypothetical protein